MLRRLVLWLLVAAFVVAVFSRLADLETLAETLARGRWEWVAAAALLQAAYYTAIAGLYRTTFLAVGVASRMRDLVGVLVASLFVNTVAPSGGMAGSALFVDEAARRGAPPARAAAAVLLARIVDSLGFSAWMLLGLAYLFATHDLAPHQIAAAATLLLTTAGLAAMLVLALSRTQYLRALLQWFARAVNGVIAWSGRPAPLSPDWADRHAEEFGQAGMALAERRSRLTDALGVAVVVHLVDMLSLAALFLAFRQPLQPGVLVAVYATGILFWKMSPVPEGVGVVESVMVLALSSMGVPAGRATVIVLAFRGLTYWLPMLTGFVLIRRLRLFRPPAGSAPTVRATVRRGRGEQTFRLTSGPSPMSRPVTPSARRPDHHR